MGRIHSGRRLGPTTGHLLTAAVLTGGILMTASCGGSDATSSGSASTTAAGATATSTAGGAATPLTTGGAAQPSGTTSGTYAPSPEPELTVAGGPAGKTERLTGVIATGTESTCRLLQLPGGHAVQVIGSDDRLVVGAEVTVEGRRVPGLASTCQEGTPFVVSAVIEARPSRS